jgi:hypothetical protein
VDTLLQLLYSVSIAVIFDLIYDVFQACVDLSLKTLSLSGLPGELFPLRGKPN